MSEARASGNINLPVVNDDLQHHAVGCYTAESAIKKGNRQSEAALATAEKLASVAYAALGSAYPKEELTRGLEEGSLSFSSMTAWPELHCRNIHSLQRKDTVMPWMSLIQHPICRSRSLNGRCASEDPASQYLLVFNPHAWEVNSNLEYDLNGMQNTTRVEDEAGNSLPHQWNPGSTETNRKRLIFGTKVPAFGYRQIRILQG